MLLRSQFYGAISQLLFPFFQECLHLYQVDKKQTAHSVPSWGFDLSRRPEGKITIQFWSRYSPCPSLCQVVCQALRTVWTIFPGDMMLRLALGSQHIVFFFFGNHIPGKIQFGKFYCDNNLIIKGMEQRSQSEWFPFCYEHYSGTWVIEYFPLGSWLSIWIVTCFMVYFLSLCMCRIILGINRKVILYLILFTSFLI